MTAPAADAAKLLPCPTFWVVERFENERSAGYWSGGNSRAFLTDIEKAIHFCRREDAMWTIMGWHWGDVKITEHSYIENTRPQPAPPTAKEIQKEATRAWMNERAQPSPPRSRRHETG